MCFMYLFCFVYICHRLTSLVCLNVCLCSYVYVAFCKDLCLLSFLSWRNKVHQLQPTSVSHAMVPILSYFGHQNFPHIIAQWRTRGQSDRGGFNRDQLTFSSWLLYQLLLDEPHSEWTIAKASRLWLSKTSAIYLSIGIDELQSFG